MNNCTLTPEAVREIKDDTITALLLNSAHSFWKTESGKEILAEIERRYEEYKNAEKTKKIGEAVEKYIGKIERARDAVKDSELVFKNDATART